jgi:outer membrane receptor for ferrienterochelin and colicins
MILFIFLVFFSSIESKEFKVINAETEQTISSVSAHFFLLDSTQKPKRVFTNEKGVANIPNLKFKKVIFRHISFEELELEISNEDDFPSIIKLSPTTFYIEEVVSTGQIRPTTIQKSVFDIKVIDKESINARAAPTLREVLMNENNVRVSKDGVLGSSMSINGLGGENVKIMIDGVPVIGRENGNINLDHINVKNAERIEIIQGPMSAIYGSDALGGVINIITKEPDKKLFMEFENYNESIGQYNLLANANFKIGENKFLLSGVRNLFQGFSPNPTFRAHLWDPREQYFADFKWLRDFGKYKVSYNSNFMKDLILNRTEPIDAPYNELGFDDEYHTNRILNSLSIAGEVAENRFVNFIANHSYYDRKTDRYLKDLVTLERTLTKDLNDQKFNNFQSFMSRGTYSHDEIVSSYSYQLGYEVRYDDGAGDRINTENSAIADLAAFFTSEYKPTEKLTINPMFRFIYNTKYDAPIIPVLNLKYTLAKNFDFRTSYARGFRAPSIKELNLEFIDQNHYIIGNPNLSAENSYTINAMLNYNFYSNQHVIKSEIKYFYNEVKDMITLVDVGFEEFVQQQIFSYSNISKVKTNGIQLNLSYFRNKVSNNLSFLYIGRWSSILNEFNYTPEVSYNLTYNIDKIDTRLALFYKYTGPIVRFGYMGTLDDDNPIINEEDLIEYKILDFHNMDINISKYLFNKSVDLSFGVKNVFDVTNIRTTGQNMSGAHSGDNTGSLPMNWGRTFFIRLTYNYN